jgi:hypothetical protein
MKNLIKTILLTLTSITIINCGGSTSSPNTSVQGINSINNDNNVSTNTLTAIEGNVSLIKITKLPNTIKGNSGLVFIDGNLWTHNDNGNEAKLYKINTATGLIEKTVNISNATNVNWEAITSDNSYLYIGDFGNNNGNRKDLKIYKILRASLETHNNIIVEVINFSYSDQTDFTNKPYNNNYDCEAFVAHQDKLYLFSKNWKNQQTRLYALENSEGNHIAQYKSTFNIQGLVSDASINSENDILILIGYSKILKPNVWLFYNFTNNAFFDNNFKKLTLSNNNEKQIEAVSFKSAYQVYISSENFAFSGFPTLDANLYSLDFSNIFP